MLLPNVRQTEVVYGFICTPLDPRRFFIPTLATFFLLTLGYIYFNSITEIWNEHFFRSNNTLSKSLSSTRLIFLLYIQFL